MGRLIALAVFSARAVAESPKACRLRRAGARSLRVSGARAGREDDYRLRTLRTMRCDCVVDFAVMRPSVFAASSHQARSASLVRRP